MIDLEKCPECGHKYAENPIFKNNVLPFSERIKPNNIIWKNLFHIKFEWLVIIISIFLILIGFNVFTAQCQEVVEAPCTFCENSGCYERFKLKEISKPLPPDFDFNNIRGIPE